MQQHAITAFDSNTITLSQLKDPPEINATTMQEHATTSSQLKGDEYNSCVKWAFASASADGEYHSDIMRDYVHLNSDACSRNL